MAQIAQENIHHTRDNVLGYSFLLCTFSVFNLELGVFGGLITPVCSYILSVLVFDFVLCCIVL